MSLLVRVLQSFQFDSFLYLSAVRVYRNVSNSSEEAALHFRPDDPDGFYCIAKLAAEAGSRTSSELDLQGRTFFQPCSRKCAPEGGNNANDGSRGIWSDPATFEEALLLTARAIPA